MISNLANLEWLGVYYTINKGGITMPVPKKRRTSSTRGQRRSHDSLQSLQLMYEKNSKLNVPRSLKKAAEVGLLRTRRSM